MEIYSQQIQLKKAMNLLLHIKYLHLLHSDPNPPLILFLEHDGEAKIWIHSSDKLTPLLEIHEDVS